MAVLLPKSALIHVPKTGGTWCRAAIKAAGIPYFESGPCTARHLSRTHASLASAYPTICVRNWLKKDMRPAKRLTFGFVRNPCAWLASAWADTIRKYGSKVPVNDPPSPKPGFWLRNCFSYDFGEFIDNVIATHSDAPSRAILGRLGFSQTSGKWQPDELSVDEIGKTETLVDDFVRILKKAGEQFNERIVCKLKPKRVAGKLSKFKKKIVWTDAQREAIYGANQFLCDTFGYSL